LRLAFLGKETQGGGSPTLFATDRETYVVQGWKVPGQQASVEIPKRLLAYLEPGTSLGVELHDTGRGTVILSGCPVGDPEALAQMDIPGHETCVEVAKAKEDEPVELLRGTAFDDLFRTFRRRAFHLEVRDSYHTPVEAGPFHRFLNGESDDLAWHQPWLGLVREATRAGKGISRVRVVTVPHVDYTRWGLTVAAHNIAAGEDIRWLPRHLVDPETLTTDDYWLFDDDRVVFTVLEPDGRLAGGAATTDPAIVRRCRAIRDQLWRVAVPHSRYVFSEYVSV
jgi:hypothetical protein